MNQNLELDCREAARQAIKDNMAKEAWQENWDFIKKLRHKLTEHEMLSHPLVKLMNEKRLSKEHLKIVFLNFRPLVFAFTDVLLKSAYLTSKVEDKSEAGIKMHDRFLIMLNLLDELGFSPDVNKNGYYQGTPFNSHYFLFEKVLTQMGVTKQEKTNFVVCQPALDILDTWEHKTDNILDLSATLIATEMIALHYSPAMKNNVAIFDTVALDSGYFHVHGTSEDETSEAADDDHEDDLWFIVAQLLTPDDYQNFENKIVDFMKKWVNLWDFQLELCQPERKLELA